MPCKLWGLLLCLETNSDSRLITMTMDDQIRTWIAQAKQSGMTDEQIRVQLLQTGWNTADVEGALHPGMDQPMRAQEKSEMTMGLTTASPKKGWLVIVSVLVVVAGWLVFAFVKGYFPATLFNSTERRAIQASAEIYCYSFTNKLRPVDFLQKRANGTLQTGEAQTGYAQVQQQAEVIAKRYGFASAKAITDYSFSLINAKKDAQYKNVIKKGDEAAAKLCGAPPSSGS
jgi:hypothetical protein